MNSNTGPSALDSQKATQLLQRRIDATAVLQEQEATAFTPDFIKWRRDTFVAIEQIFGSEGRHLADFGSVSFDSTYDDLRCEHPGGAAGWFRAVCRDGLAEARAVLQSMIDEVRDFGLTRQTAATTDARGLIEWLCFRFHLVVRQLRERHGGRTTLEVEDEYDTQDLLHALLRLHFDDIRPEEWTPSYAGGSSRMDFLLKLEQVVIEVKKTRKGLAAKEVGEQLIVDIQKYKEHPDCKTLICFVYDPEGRISNPRGLENDLNRDADGIKVRVVIAPKGT